MHSKKDDSTVPVYKRRWFLFSALLLCCLTLFFIALPIGAKWYITRWLEDHGAEEASIDHLWFNPLTFKLVAEGVVVKDGGKTLLSNDRMVINLTVWPLIRKDVSLYKVVYSDLFVEVAEQSDGSWKIGSYRYDPDASEEEIAEEVESRWDLFADHATFQNCTIVLKTKETDLTFSIDTGELHRLSTWEGGPVGTLELTGTLNKSPLQIEITRISLAPGISVAGHLSLADFNLDQLAGLVGDSLLRLAGITDLEGDVSYVLAENDRLEVSYDGNLLLKQFDIEKSVVAASLQHLQWQGKTDYASAADSKPTITADGRLLLNGYHVSSETDGMVVDGAGAAVEGNATVTLSKAVAASFEGILEARQTEAKIPQGRVAQERMRWDGKLNYDSQTAEAAKAVTADGSLDLEGIRYQSASSNSHSLSVESHIGWSGNLLFEQPGTGNRFDVKGVLSTTATRLFLNTSGLAIEAPRNTFELDYQLTAGKGLEISGKGSAALEDIFLRDKAGTIIASADTLNVAEVNGRGKQGAEAVDVEATTITATIPGSLPLEASLDKIRLEKATSEDFATFSISEITFDAFLAAAVQNGSELARFERLSLWDTTLGSDCDISVHSGNLENLRLLERDGSEGEHPPLALGNANLFSLCYAGDEIPTIDTLYLNDLKAYLHRNGDGELDIASRIQEMKKIEDAPQDSKPAPADKDTSSEPFQLPVFIREFVVKGDSSIHFRDDTLPETFTTQFDIDALQLLGMESDASDQIIQLTLTGELDQRAPVTLTGTLSPFDEQIELDADLNLKNYPVKNLSGYTIQKAGAALSGGRLQLDSTIQLDGRKLDMKNDLLIRELATASISKEQAEEFHNQLPIPLDMALSMLRDGDDNISLSIPVSGVIGEMDIDITDLFLTAINKAIVPATTGYLTYALGPYAALAYVGYKVGENILEIDLPAVKYENSRIEIPEDQVEYLERVATVLKDKQQRDLQLCPRVSTGELLPAGKKERKKSETPELDEQSRAKLERLGQDRAEKLKDYFMRNHSISANRLLICNTAIIEDEGKPSEVNLEF